MNKPSIFAPATRSWALRIGIVMLAAGCGGPQKPADPPPAAAKPEPEKPVPQKPPTVTLRVDGISGSKGAHELAPGEVLRSGDQMAINVAVDQPAYIYVAASRAKNNLPGFIYPKSGDQLVSPEQPLRIPSNPEKWIPLDNEAGQEDIFVYAANKPISATELSNLLNTDVAFAKKVAEKRAAKAAAASAAKPKPAKGGKGKSNDDALSAGSRGLQLDDDEADGAAPAPASPDVVVKRFSVTHK
jgi:hypothetical protein